MNRTFTFASYGSDVLFPLSEVRYITRQDDTVKILFKSGDGCSVRVEDAARAKQYIAELRTMLEAVLTDGGAA